MNVQRLSLGTVELSHKTEELTPTIINETDLDVSDAAVYSAFKYGNGDLAARYGSGLAHLSLDRHPELLGEAAVYVTSSAYKVAPPASYALVEPFCRTARELAGMNGSDTEFVPFKIDRGHITEGDYASMSLEAREAVMQQNGLSIDPGLAITGHNVVVLDDIYVTGSHETSLQKVLSSLRPETVYFGYILRVADGADPKIESVLNGMVAGSVDQLIGYANEASFVPNARICKYILSQSIADIERFCTSVPAAVTRRVAEYIEGDGLHSLSTYALGSLAYTYTLDLLSVRTHDTSNRSVVQPVTH